MPLPPTRPQSSTDDAPRSQRQTKGVAVQFPSRTVSSPTGAAPASTRGTNLTRAQSFNTGSLVAMLRHGATTAALCTLIAIVLTASGKGSFTAHLTYSLPNGLIAWLVMDIGRQFIGRDAVWPHGPRDFALVAAGIIAGLFGGNLVGDAISGRPLLDFLDFERREFASTLMMTLGGSFIICYFFYSGGRARLLEGQLARVQRDASEARLKLLETQLAPHMLFNTLANLRALISADPPRAVAMLDRLDSYLRAVLAGSRGLSHPLAAEFARLADYLELMSVRMGPRLRYALELPEHLRDFAVPPLLLQPLVENAIRHGLEPLVAGGEIRVCARRESSQLVIDVRDTGSGLDETVQAQGGGFGLTQVRERLDSLYGGRAQLILTSSEGGGTLASLRLPDLKEPKPR